ncbi:MAG: PLP-dependent aminotransferase family protein [Verrucomicrobia bacterium]|nr:PLP-dependent aminotransferase family protein [Verrucomicrobiota bacterium]
MNVHPNALRYARRAAHLKGSAVRDILKMTESPGIISFAAGLPAGDAFPVKELVAICQSVLTEDATATLQYGLTEGFYPLRQWVCSYLKETVQLPCEPERVLITTGSQQALDLVARVFIDPGDTVIVADPSYAGALQAFSAYEPRLIGVPSDEEGMCPTALRHAVANSPSRPKLIYLVTNFHNPTGLTTTLKRRGELARIAGESGVLIVEDDPYGRLRYSGRHLPALAALPEALHWIYLGTCSKVLAPGLRVAWLVASDGEVVGKLVTAKQAVDLHTPGLTQRLVAAYCSAQERLDGHVARLIKIYRERRDTMAAAIAHRFPHGSTWTLPEGGLFLWVEVPEPLNTTQLLPAALERQVAYVPGAGFWIGDARHHTLRLNFSNANCQLIEEGIARLGALLKEKLDGQRPANLNLRWG